MTERGHSTPAALAAADKRGPGLHVDIEQLKGDHLAGSHPGLEHEPDHGLVPAVAQRLERGIALRWRARLEERAELVVGEWLDDAFA